MVHTWLELPDECLPHIQKGMEQVSLAPDLAGASWSDILLFLVPTWHQKGTLMAPLNWPGNQRHTKDQIEKVPSWSHKSTQLMTKKAGYFISILILVSEPIKLNEMMRLMSYRNEKAFRDNYIKPLRETGLITLTNLEKPTNPENKYTITEAGRAFLAGN